MKAVLRLVPHNARRGAEYLVADFDTVGKTSEFSDLCADDGVSVVVRRQAVHELCVGSSGGGYRSGINSVGQQQRCAFTPDLGWFSHGNPDVCVYELRTRKRGSGIFGDRDSSTTLGCQVRCQRLDLW